ncbi:hypothetical protein L7F22_035352 [Adiantum nelumboides]|nr:hypothetical protein [Adiantum nelumboides]
MGRASDNDVDLLGNPTTLLVFNYLNDHGAQVFTNKRNKFAILVNNQGETLSHPNAVYVSDQGDHYMDARGFKFLKTNRPNDLNKWGNLVQGSRAANEPLIAHEKGTSKVGFDFASRPMPAPSAPPLLYPYRNNAPAPSAATSPFLLSQISPRLVASTYGKAILTNIPVTRVYNDQNTSVLYEDSQKDLYMTSLLPNGFYPPTVTMNVYESQGGRSFEYINDWANVYTKATSEDVKYLTWHGIPIEKRHMGSHPYLGSAAPFNPLPKTTMSGHAKYAYPNTHYPPMEEDALNHLGGSMSHLGFGNNGMPSHRGATNPIPLRPTGFLGPHTPRMGDSQPGFRAPRPNVSTSGPFARAHTPRVVESAPTLDVPNNMLGPNAFRPPKHGSCFFKARVQQQQQQAELRGYQNWGNPSVGGNLERSVPVLGMQPPLPGAAAVRYVDVASSEATNSQDLVPVEMYYEEEYNFNDYYSDPIYDDHQQLMMVGQRPPNNFGHGQPGMGRGRNHPPQGLGPCFKCGSMDHWARGCPKETQPHMDWPKVERFCPRCHVDHLSKDCPNKPVAATAGPSTSSLNFVEMIPSPSTSGIDEIASLRVITRSQAKNGIPIVSDDQARPSPKKKRRKKRNQKSASGTSHEELFKGNKEAEKTRKQKAVIAF